MTEKPTYEELLNRLLELKKQLKDSRDEKYRILFEKSKDAILIIENQKFVDCNQTTVEMLGYQTKSELLNTHPSELSPDKQPDGRDSFSKAIEMMELAIQNGSHRFEWDHRKANGDVFPVEVLLTAISTDDKHQVIHTIWRDISDRKKAEKEIKKEKETLSMILEGHPHGIAMIDDKGQYIYINPNFTKLTGYTLKDIPSRKQWFEKAYPDNQYRQSVIEIWQQDSKDIGDGTSREFYITGKDGGIKSIEFRSTFLKDNIIFVLTDVTDKRVAEKALRESQQRLSAHLQSTPVGAVSWDLDFTVNEWNSAAEKIFGYTKQEAMGKHAAELIVPADLKERVDGVFQDLLAGKGGERSVNENITRSGKKILCDWYNTVVKNDMAVITGVASLVNDITERKRFEDINKVLFAISNAVNITLNLDDLYEQIHCLLGEILDVTNFFIAIINEQKKTLYFPYYVDTMEENFSPLRDFKPNDSLTGLVVSNRKPQLLKMDQLRDLSNKKGIQGQVPLIWMGVPLIIKDTVIGVMAVQSYTDPDLYDEQDLKVLSSISDQVAISIDRKRTDEELRESEKKYRYLFNHAPAGMYEIDFITSRFAEFNDVLCQHLGYSEEELMAMNPLDLLTENGKQTFKKEYKKALRNEKPSNTVEYDIIGKNGRKFCAVLSHDFIYRDSELIGARVVAHDITERKKMEDIIIQSEKRLNQAQKMEAIGTLAGGIAHDFNNILSGIFGYSQLAETHIQNPEKAKNHIQQIIKGAQRAAELVNQILTFSRQKETKKHPFRAYLEVKEALKLLRSSIPATIEIIEKIDSRSLIIADPIKIHQVVINLCTNANHAMRETGGQLTVSLTDVEISKPKHLRNKIILPGKYIKLEVRDTGHGMDEKTIEKAFDPYYTTKEMGEGTGLGLAIVLVIVDEHDGYLEVLSTPGKGTNFYIYFPIIEQASGPEQIKNERIPVFEGNESIMTQNKRVPVKKILVNNCLVELVFSATNGILRTHESAEFLIFANFVLSLFFMFLSSVSGFGLAIATHLQQLSGLKGLCEPESLYIFSMVEHAFQPVIVSDDSIFYGPAYF